ncbi:MAG: aspartate/glutamate racemase family protein [Clostridiaceae bacterium]|nr:aspartate/glutamate racemase family protein [Clostridiaceae bacterium]
MQDLTGKRLGIVHAAVATAVLVRPAIEAFVPEIEILQIGDDTIRQRNRTAPPGAVPRAGFLTFIQHAKALQDAGCHMVLLTCPILAQAVELARPVLDIPLLQLSRPMMDLAVRRGGRVGMIATQATVVPPSERLLRVAAAEAGQDVTVEAVLCSEAERALVAGDTGKYIDLLRKAIVRLASDVDSIVLTQVSMSLLEHHLEGISVPVYVSTRTGFERVRSMLEAMP